MTEELKKIVLIDDDKEVCGLLKNVLERTGRYKAFAATSGKEGLKFCLEQNPNLVFLDYVLVNEKGDEVIRALKENPATKNIPIVLMSGLGEMVYSTKKENWSWQPNSSVVQKRGELPDALMWKKYSIEVADEMGVNAYLPKPFSKQSLIDFADSILNVPVKEKEENI